MRPATAQGGSDVSVNARRVAFAVLLATVAILAGATIRYADPSPDARQNLAMAHNLAVYNVASVRRAEGTTPPPPDMRREPFYPLTLSSVLRHDPAPLSCLLAAGEECRTQSILLRGVNVLWHLALVAVTYAAARTILLGWWPLVPTALAVKPRIVGLRRLVPQ